MKLHVGDTVLVIAGKDRGKKGKIESVRPQSGEIVVEKVNRVKKHLKKSGRYQQGGIVEIAQAIPAAKVILVCPHCSKLTRVAIKRVGQEKVRICRHCGKALTEEKK